MTIYCPECNKPKRWWQKSFYSLNGNNSHTHVAKNGIKMHIAGFTDRGGMNYSDSLAYTKAVHYKCAIDYVEYNMFSKKAVEEKYGRKKNDQRP